MTLDSDIPTHCWKCRVEYIFNVENYWIQCPKCGYFEHLEPDREKEIKPFKRLRPRLSERFSPCEWCNHPISERNHLIPFNEYGETFDVVYLCANCHEIFHAYFDHKRYGHLRAFRFILKVEQVLGEDDIRIIKAKETVKKSIEKVIAIDGSLIIPPIERKRRIKERMRIQTPKKGRQRSWFRSR